MIKLILIFFSYFIVNAISSSYLVSENPFYSLLIESTFIIGLFFIFKKTLINEAKIFIKNKNSNIYYAVYYWMLGSLAMLITGSIINAFFPITTANDDIIKMLINKNVFIMSISTIIFAPIIEELIFRFIPRQIIKNNFIYILFSSLVFSSIHVLTKTSSFYDYLLIIPYACMGIALAAGYLKNKNVYAPILMHVIHNSFAFILTII